MLEEANHDHLLEELRRNQPAWRNPPRLKAGIRSRFGGACFVGVAEQDYECGTLGAATRSSWTRNHSRTSGNFSMLMHPWLKCWKLISLLKVEKSRWCESGRQVDGWIVEWSSCWWALSVDGAAATAASTSGEIVALLRGIKTGDTLVRWAAGSRIPKAEHITCLPGDRAWKAQWWS